MIDVSLFSDAISIVKEIGNGVVGLVSLPQKRREEYHAVVDETFTLLDHALLCVIQRLSDCVRIQKEYGDIAFATELRSLQSVSDWEKIERDVRLCHSLRKASGEMRSLISNIGDKLSLSDTNKFWYLVNVVLEGEVTMATQIANMLYHLSNIADLSEALDTTNECIQDLKSLRRDLIETQVELMKQI
jgi:hypothetical protein